MRVFVAVEVTDRATRERIGTFRQSAGGAGKAVELHNLHFTLRFLGEITEESARAAADALKSVRFRPFNVALRGAGSFGRPPRVVWAGTDPDGSRELLRLAGAVNDAVGGRADKPFRPHLTILRIKKGQSIDISGYDGYEWGVQHVDAIKLKRSVLGRTGPAYTDLAEVPAG
jgi:2'-5' RNA ligase